VQEAHARQSAASAATFEWNERLYIDVPVQTVLLAPGAAVVLLFEIVQHPSGFKAWRHSRHRFGIAGHHAAWAFLECAHARTQAALRRALARGDPVPLELQLHACGSIHSTPACSVLAAHSMAQLYNAAAGVPQRPRPPTHHIARPITPHHAAASARSLQASSRENEKAMLCSKPRARGSAGTMPWHAWHRSMHAQGMCSGDAQRLQVAGVSARARARDWSRLQRGVFSVPASAGNAGGCT
jgi:hypothetical protein